MLKTPSQTLVTNIFSFEGKVRKASCVAVLFWLCCLAVSLRAQSAAPKVNLETTPLCVLQKQVAEGKHQTVRVYGMYGPGLDHTILEEPSCPAESTWVELALRSDENEEKLRKLLGRSQQAYVVVVGKFCGPPLPDPNLPEAIRKSYHSGWGHLGAFKTKLVVYMIREVRVAAPPKS